MKPNHISLLSLSAMALLASAGQAQVSISFESSENYTSGQTIAGQPNPANGSNQWFFQDTGTAGDLNTLGQVSNAFASSGSQSFVWNPDRVDMLGARMNLRLDNNASMWGSEGIPSLASGTGDTIYFSFNFLYGTAHGSNTAEVLLFQIANAFSFSLKANGTITYNDGATATNALGADSSSFQAQTSEWYSVTGALNFADQVYSLSVNGVNQGNSIALGSSPSLNPGLRFSAATVINVAQTVYFDDIHLTTIPEPATYAALFGLMVLGLAIYRRRAHR